MKTMDMMKMMHKAREMQEQMQKVQEQLKSTTVEGSAGGGAVTVTCTADGNVQALKIKPETLTGGDATLVEDLILTAIRQAQETGRQVMAREMGKVTKGLNIPGLNLGL
ncbi:MAG: YbaB/EbfC family nucleoid-associated protein [Verrucomicrobiae bacterium]|nr:YbaB/EbfC family nucleoid-associated protein [Verrucomicrobiae bacterium]